jgi:hypothetical protein
MLLIALPFLLVAGTSGAASAAPRAPRRSDRAHRRPCLRSVVLDGIHRDDPALPAGPAVSLPRHLPSTS